MTARRFYKFILLKIIPVSLALIFFMGGLSLKFLDGMPPDIIINYTCVSVCVILLAEICASFFMALKILQKFHVRDKKRAEFYLLCIPYFPALSVSLFCSFFLIMNKSPNYKYLAVYISAIISTVNFLSSVVLNIKLNTFSLISEDK